MNPPESAATTSPLRGVIVSIPVQVGDTVSTATGVAVVESMKMEHIVRAETAGHVTAIAVNVGDTVDVSQALVYVDPRADTGAAAVADSGPDLDRIRPELAEALARVDGTLDAGRPEAVAKRHAQGRLTIRESLARLLDDGSFVEYGGLTIAAQRLRRQVDDLIAKTPADGLLTGTGTVDGLPVAVLAYDYTVLAGTQGLHNHQKTDRLLEIAARQRLPLVLFAEGGGGRPGDTDTSAVALLTVTSFRMMAKLTGTVPTVAIVSGYCFAGNAALAGSCDVIIGTEGSSLGMGGPAMIEGGGLGVVAPHDVGPMEVQWANGVLGRLVPDDPAAIDDARHYLSFFNPDVAAAEPADDQRLLRHLVPENRLRAYDVRPIIDTLADPGSVLELRGGFGAGVVTALARIGGVPAGVLANNSRHLGGAIDGDAADKAADFLTLCDAHRLPVVSLCDTPGFMVGPDAEKTATVRRFGAMFQAGAKLSVPMVLVVLRKAYGLGAMAMAGGDMHAPIATLSWPTGEFGGMGLEGAVRLGFRKELDAIADPAEREQAYQNLVAAAYEQGKALNIASVFEIDAVIDPADTRAEITKVLAHHRDATSAPR